MQKQKKKEKIEFVLRKRAKQSRKTKCVKSFLTVSKVCKLGICCLFSCIFYIFSLFFYLYLLIIFH